MATFTFRAVLTILYGKESVFNYRENDFNKTMQISVCDRLIGEIQVGVNLSLGKGMGKVCLDAGTIQMPRQYF